MGVEEADNAEAGTSTTTQQQVASAGLCQNSQAATTLDDDMPEEPIGEEQCDIIQEMNWQNCEKSIAFLTHNEALRQLLKQSGPNNFLASWTEDDCSGLLIQLSKYLCDEDGAGRIVRYFRDTTTNEVLDCFNDCKEINKRASQERSRLNEFNDDVGSSTKQKCRAYPTWSSLLVQAKKSRGISDESSSAVASFLLDCSSDSAEFSDFDSPDYKLIYNHLASVAQGYALKGIRNIDAAIILEIFGDMEREIGAMPKLVSFFKQMFTDFQNFPREEFKLGEELMEENIGQSLMNTLNFPDDIVDLSSMYQNDKCDK